MSAIESIVFSIASLATPQQSYLVKVVDIDGKPHLIMEEPRRPEREFVQKVLECKGMSLRAGFDRGIADGRMAFTVEGIQLAEREVEKVRQAIGAVTIDDIAITDCAGSGSEFRARGVLFYYSRAQPIRKGLIFLISRRGVELRDW